MLHDYMIDDEQWRLRPVVVGDAEFIVNLRRQGHVVGRVHDVSDDVESQRQWIADYLERDREYYWIIESPQHEPLGTVSLYHYDQASNSIEYGRWVMVGGGASSFNALRLMRRVFELAFERLGVERVVFDVVATNARVLRFARSLGARETHTDRGLFVIGGQAVDMVWFEVSRTAWPELREQWQQYD